MKKMKDQLIKSFNYAKNESDARLLNIEEKMKLADNISTTTSNTQNEPIKQPTIKAAFSCPADEYSIIDQIADRMLSRKKVVNRSEILRIGLLLLKNKSDNELNDLFNQIPELKVGRKS